MKRIIICYLLFFCIHTLFAYEHPGGMHPKSQIEYVKKQIQQNNKQFIDGLSQLRQYADSALLLEHHALADFAVPGYYVKPQEHRQNSLALQTDAFNAYACALAWQLTGEKKYADRSLYFLNSWAQINTQFSEFDGPLVMIYSGTAMMMAAELMYHYEGWNKKDKMQFSQWASNVYKKAANDIRTRKNNWGDWGRLGSLLVAWFHDDEAEVKENVRLIKSDLFAKIAADGSMPEETRRGKNGIWYTYFSLAPITASCWISYQATNENLFFWEQDGRSIKKALDYLLYYNQHPDEWKWEKDPVTGSPQNNFPAQAFWPANLIEAMSGIYQDKSYPEYTKPHRPLSYTRHHFAWSFPTLMPITLNFHQSNASSVYEADIIIYGGTSAAVIAAVESVREGKSVIVVSPDTHLGGLTSGGLGFTDTGNKSVIGGLAREFYHQVWLNYDDSLAWKWEKKSEYGNKGQGTPAIDGEQRTMWIFEPSVAERIMEKMIADNSIQVLRDEWLDREHGVVKSKNQIVSFKCLSGKEFIGKIFIDATYEGDLMAAAKVSYHVGREDNAKYGETWNGVQPFVFQHGHYFKEKIDPYVKKGDPNSGLLPYISDEKIAKKGSGDNKIQAYCFRLCMSNHPDNRIPFPKPANYDPANYELLGRVFDSGWKEWFVKYDVIPNKKTDTNNHGPFSADFIGMNYDYPEASYEKRKEIIKAHEDYQKGLLYYVANDQRVPVEIRSRMNEWGLAKDEFVDNGNWPHQLYIREARRMLGTYVMTENDVLIKKEVPNPIGMGSYSLDSHNVQRFVTDEGYVQNEGDIGVSPKKPYSVSYGSIIPKREECTNLMVPVCVSSSHIAFGSIRMEPVFMILGQSAAVAASLAIDKKLNIQDVPYDLLKKKLLEKQQILTVD